MPVLRNSRHEAFAQHLAKGSTQDAAYAAAGYKPHRYNAHRLSTNERVRARVEELTERVAEKAEWTAADRLRSLKTIHDSVLDKDPRVAISAIGEANKMQGSHAPAKHQHSGRLAVLNITPDQLQDLSDDDLAALERALPVLEMLGVVGSDQGPEMAEGD